MRLFLAGFAVLLSAKAAVAFQDCSISERLGEVYLNGDADQITAVVGTRVALGSVVETGSDGAAVLTCRDIKVAVGSDTRFVLQNTQERPRASLLQGILGLIGNRLGASGNHAIETSRLVAAVRSTEWIVTAGQAEDTVFVQEGTVMVSTPNQTEVALKTGNGVVVTNGAEALTPRQWETSRIEQTTARLPLGWP